MQNSKKLKKKILSSLILALSLAIIALYVVGIYIPEKSIDGKRPTPESEER